VVIDAGGEVVGEQMLLVQVTVLVLDTVRVDVPVLVLVKVPDDELVLRAASSSCASTPGAAASSAR
jgi:hypothetical protein